MKSFEEVYAINVNDKTETKDGLTYLSWAWAWAEFKKLYPDASYDIERDECGRCYFGDPDIGYMVYTAVLADGIRHTMWLPVLDGAGNAMKREPYTYEVKNKNFKYATRDKQDGKYYDKYGNEQTEFITKKVAAMTMFDVNKTIMRCLTKNLAMFGLGLYIYAGEDLPEGEDGNEGSRGETNDENKPKPTPKTQDKAKDGERITKAEMVEKYGVKNVEQMIAWLENKMGVRFKDWTADDNKEVRAFLSAQKTKRDAEAAKFREELKNAGEELPFGEVQ